jgi:hypothetical protein
MSAHLNRGCICGDAVCTNEQHESMAPNEQAMLIRARLLDRYQIEGADE